MFSADLGGAAPASTPAATDPPFQKVALLLHGDGTNGAQNNTFLDGSTNNFTITRTGNVAQGTFSPFSLAEGQWSNYFNQSTDYLSVASTSAFSFGTGDFTWEFWIYPTASNWTSSNTYLLSFGNNDGIIAYIGNTILYYNPTTGSGSPLYSSGGTISKDTWSHVAVTRASGTTRIFVNGALRTSGSDTNNYSTALTGYVAQNQNMQGYISNVRVVSGSALYTSAFTPPTASLTAVSGTQWLTCQSNRLKDNSSNNFSMTVVGTPKVTAFSPFAPSATYSASTNGGSGYFDGSGDCLGAADNSAFVPGTGDFTVEFLMYTLSGVGNPAMFTFGNYANGIMLRQSNANLEIYIRAVQVYIGAAFKQNAWTHIAISRTGTSLRIFADGIQLGSTITNSANINPVASSGAGWNLIFVGAETDASKNPQNYFLGHLSNVRYVVGTALYTANFTPPTAPLTAATNTQLLLNCTNAGIIDNAGKNDIETVGNAQISTSVKKYGTGSMSFNLSANGDSLKIPCIPQLDLSSGDFTLEFWFYVNSWQVGSFIAQSSNFHVGGDGASGGRVYYQAGSITAAPLVTGVSASTWHHLAIVRSSGITKMYVDGVAAATSTTDTWTRDLTTPFTVGYKSSYFNGYIDDLRITKGQALYTANFTPPTQAFPNV